MPKIELETLTPIILDEEQKEKLNYSNYEALLDDVMKSDKYCNIALSGRYGAGKSTILNTYEKEHDYKSIHISLAKLNDEETGNVEAKLINQIIHQIDPKLIPQTLFKVKKSVEWQNVLLVSTVIFAFIISVIYLAIVPSSQQVADATISLYDLFWRYCENKIMLVVGAISFLTLIFLIVNAQMKRPLIKSIHVDKSQIELVETEQDCDTEEGKFDKYMDEIIYLFEKSEIDYLVIEDLDRLDDVRIFYELRQINYLINKKIWNKDQNLVQKNAQNRKIRFIYMVRDELFKKSEERTKFFDIIIPIVPAMDNSNSYELLKKMMGVQWIEMLDEAYLKMICMNIHDYRMLKNIFNEFQIYYNQLRIEDYRYKPMKLFAMVTYKNMWPEDYANLQDGKGIVFDALKNIDDFRNEAIHKVEGEIDDFKHDIETIQKEVAIHLDELDAIFFEGKLVSNSYYPGYYEIDGVEEHTYDTRVAFVRDLKAGKNVVWYRSGYSSGTRIEKSVITDAFEKLKQNEEYASRRKKLEDYCENGITSLETKIETKMQEKENINRAGFREVTAYGTPDTFNNLFPLEMELIKIFILDEMISDDYSSYMTYFYPYSISNDELRFLNKVYARTNDSEQSETIIEHPELVISYIKPEDWDSIALPNKYICKYLVQTRRDELTNLIHNLQLHSNYSFVVMMMKELEEGNLLFWINHVVEEWENFVETYLNNDNWNNTEIFEYVLTILESVEEKKVPISLVNDYFRTNEELLIEQCDDRVIGILEKIGFEFKSLSRISEKKQDEIYLLGLYQLNKDNVDHCIKQFYGIQETDELYKMHYSIVMSQEDTSLARKVKENLDEYVEEIYIPYCAKNSEELDAVIDFLNSSAVDYVTKCRLIEEINILITDITRVKSLEIRNELLKNKCISFTNTNIISIWAETETISEYLQDFLAYHYISEKCGLSFSFAKRYFGETSDEHPKAFKFIGQLLDLNEIGKAYSNLIADVNIRYTALATIPWNGNQIFEIVQTNIIAMTEKNLQLMRKAVDSNVFFLWVQNQISDYLKLMEKEELRSDKELQALLSMDEISDNDKIKCIRMCTSRIHVTEKHNTRVVQEIFEYDLFDGDFISIIRRYNAKRYGKQFMMKLGSYMVTYISSLLVMHFPLPHELSMYIMKSNNVTETNKKLLLATQAVYFDIEQIKDFLKLCGGKAFLDAFEGQNPKVDALEENRALIEAFIKRKWISSYKAIGTQYIIYPRKAIVKKQSM